MRKSAILIIALLSINFGWSQDEKTEYLFSKDGDVKIGGFGGPFVQFATHGESFAVYSGGGGAAIINGRFFLGGYGMGLATTHYVNVTNPQNSTIYTLDFGHGGLWLGYNLRPSRVAHFNFSIMAGGGYLSTNAERGDSESLSLNRTSAFVLNPSVGIELNLLPWMKIGATAGYQYVAARARPQDVNDLNTPMLQLQFKFGYFAEQ